MRRRKLFLMRSKTVLSGLLLIAVVALLSTPQFFRFVYPVYFYDEIQLQAVKVGVNPMLVAAIIRVESHFREDDVSHAGAIGLMQLMPATAHWVAVQAGERNYTPSRLAVPSINIRLGSFYMAYLIKQFHGNLPEAIAAYNAGPNRVQRWLSAGVWSGDEVSVEDIPVLETRHFVARVLYTYDIFQRFY